MLGARRIAIPLRITPDELKARLNRANDTPEGPWPGGLREYISSLHFSPGNNGAFSIELEGLSVPFRPGVQIEGRGRVALRGDHRVLEFEVGADAFSMWRLWVTIAVLFGLAWYNLALVDPPNTLAYVLVPFAGFVYLFMWVQVRVVGARVWPGLVRVIQQLVSTDS